MDLRDHITRETSALADRLMAVADNVIEQVRTELAAQTSLTATVTEQLEAERVRSASLAADVETLTAAARTADEARLNAEAALEARGRELDSLREMLESARAEVTKAAEARAAEAAQKVLHQQTHETVVRDLERQLDEAMAEARGLQVSFAEAEKRTAAAGAATGDELRALRQQVDELAGAARANEARVEAAEAAVTAMRAEVDDANAIADAAGREMSALRERLRRAHAMMNRAATALTALDAATTVPALVSGLVRQLATDFARVAIFRVKDNHLEGDVAAGLDDSIDITKIVVPKGLSSLVTKAASGGRLEYATHEQISEARPPFGGSPASALAVPLMFEGAVFAVAYADADTPFTDAHRPLASALVRHANTVLARLAQELKAERQLRQYARTLIHDAEAMFTADTDAGVPVHDRLRRLRESLDYAHDLFDHRAELEAVPAIRILDEEIAAAAGAKPPSPFATALSSVAQDQRARRNAS